jgi:hypothetical protein
MGLKGQERPKAIELVKKAANEESRVRRPASKKAMMLTYGHSYSVRLIDAAQYGFGDFTFT